MAGNLSFDQLQEAVRAGEIDTVVACFPDMQGRLVGKRFQAEYFLDGAYKETHGCDYLLANDIDMEPVPGYAAANWEKGYGDFIMKPDLATLRRIPWLPGHRAGPLRHARSPPSRSSPAFAARDAASTDRAAAAMNMPSYFASELEFYLFDETYEAMHAKPSSEPKTAGNYIQDYHILQTTKEEGVMRAIRKRPARRRHSGRELERRVGPGPGGDQRPLFRRARHGRQARHPEERLQGDRLRPGQGRSPSCRNGITASPARRRICTFRCGTRPARRRCSSIAKAEFTACRR